MEVTSLQDNALFKLVNLLIEHLNEPKTAKTGKLIGVEETMQKLRIVSKAAL